MTASKRNPKLDLVPSAPKATATRVEEKGALLRKADVAKRLGVHVRTVERLVREGHLRAVKLTPGPRGSVRVWEADLHAYLAGLKGA